MEQFRKRLRCGSQGVREYRMAKTADGITLNRPENRQTDDQTACPDKGALKITLENWFHCISLFQMNTGNW